VKERLRWEVEGRDWPLREASRFVAAGGLNWHVQQLGAGPALWLIHGTGASTHSWRDVAPLLAQRFTVIAMDLPGHGFTGGRLRAGSGLTAVAGGLRDLMATIGAPPPVAVGAHSAGAAIACQMALAAAHAAPIVAFGPALLPFPGVSGPIFSGLARLLFLNPFAPRLFARIARSPRQVEDFLKRSTGSRINARGVELYRRLFGSPDHVAGALSMMAHWELGPMERALPTLPVPLHVVQGEGDTAVPMREAERAARLAGAKFTTLPGLGHLAHEEAPERAAELIAAEAIKIEEGIDGRE